MTLSLKLGELQQQLMDAQSDVVRHRSAIYAEDDDDRALKRELLELEGALIVVASKIDTSLSVIEGYRRRKLRGE